MRERPILFSAPMIRAILDGRKTQTRRLEPRAYEATPGLVYLRLRYGIGVPASEHECPYGIPGNRLWVRETWAYYGGDEYLYQQDPAAVSYRADALPLDHVPGDKWRPSIFMPRWASRITLKVTGVRVERLQEISEEDAECDGAQPASPPEATGATYRAAFRELWDSINTKRAPWSRNPWVWVIEFRRIER